MKAAELRIGNWITVMGSLPKQVTAYHLYMMETYVPEQDEASYSEMTGPIPLTEEWLVKLGIPKEPDQDYPGYASWVKGCFNLEYADDKAVKEGVYFMFEVYSHYVPVKYVHQLQNLFFALTGEELTAPEPELK